MLNRAAVRIVRDVREWLFGQPDHGAARAEWQPGRNAISSLEILLQARQDWLNCPDPTLWRTGDAHRLLVDVAAARLTDVHRVSEHGPAVLQILFDFLEATDRFHPAAMRVATLRKELARAAAKFPAAMADESVWRLAKRVFTAMLADGVDPDDDDAVDGWAAAFSTASPQHRRDVLGPLLDRQPELLTAQFVIRNSQVAAIAPGRPIPQELRRHDPSTYPGCSATPANPAIVLPAVDELAAAARESAMLRNQLACGRWATSGQGVTKHGFPTPANTRTLVAALGFDVRDSVRDPRDHIGLLRNWSLALNAEVLQLRRTEVVAGPALATLEQAMADAADPNDTLGAWREIADVAVSEPTRRDTRDSRAAELSEFRQPWGPRALGELYRADDTVAVVDLVDTLVADHLGPAANEVLAMMTGVAVRTGLLAANEAGIVTVQVGDDIALDPEIAPLVDDSGTVLGDPLWAWSHSRAPASSSPRSAGTSCA
jgi:hypothetical protein